MTPAAHRALAVARRLLISTAIGFASGAIAGVLIVLIGWFPGAMTTFAENPGFVDPWSVLLAWSTAWALALGSVGAVIGFGVGAIPRKRSNARTGRGSGPHGTTASGENARR